METMRLGLGRNDLCRCGSGKKFKKCCLARQQSPVPLPPPRGPLPAGSGTRPASDGIPEYVVVKGKGHTHRSKLQPGDECRLKDGSWAIYRPDLMNGGSVLVKDKGWIPERELKPGDQYQHNGVWVTFQPERVIRTTQEHPFFVYGRGWTPLAEIKVGDLLRTEDGWVPVTKIEDTGKWEVVYNLRVADHHTYFVGGEDWGFAVWAHNVYIQHLPGADTALNNLGSVYALRAKQLYDDLVRRNEKGLTTIAVSQVTEGGALRELVVVYGPAHVFNRVEAALNGTGAVCVHAPMGGAHAEEYLYTHYHGAAGFTGAIGISHKDGPCPTCRTFFNGVGFRNIWWDRDNSM